MREKQLETLRKLHEREFSKVIESLQDNFYINNHMVIYLENPVNVDIPDNNILDIRKFLIDTENQEYINLNVTSKELYTGIKNIAGRKYGLSVRYQPDNKHTINARLLKAVLDLLKADKVEIPKCYYKPWKISGKYGTGFLLPINDTPQKELFYTI